MNDLTGNTPVSVTASGETAGLENGRKHLFDFGEELFATVRARYAA